VIALSLGERIKKARKALDLTQQKFADQIGTTQNALTGYETGRRNPSSSVINNICKTFDVNEEWLRTGKGEMFNAKSSAAMEALARERGLTHSDLVLIEKFLSMKQESRLAVAEYMLEVAAALNSDTTPLDIVTTRKNTDIDAEVGYYRSDLLMDKRLSAADAGQQQEIKSPQEMTVAELHAELDRQIAEEKKRAAGQSVSGPGRSEKVTG
jgi:transcriptional regulator with XRE-family HTH domain